MRVAFVDTGSEALALDRIVGHDAVAIALDLPDMPGMHCAAAMLAGRRRPVVMFGDGPTLDDALAALRLGVVDLLASPVDDVQAEQAFRRCLRARSHHMRSQKRVDRLRSVLRRVLQDRRSLNMRVDLVCRDLVGAHRRLFQRVLSMEEHAEFEP